jgi:hypothetical protein
MPTPNTTARPNVRARRASASARPPSSAVLVRDEDDSEDRREDPCTGRERRDKLERAVLVGHELAGRRQPVVVERARGDLPDRDEDGDREHPEDEHEGGTCRPQLQQLGDKERHEA